VISFTDWGPLVAGYFAYLLLFAGLGVVGGENGEPLRVCAAVVVDEREQLAPRALRAGVPRRGRTLV
jgi:hypothetical protein